MLNLIQISPLVFAISLVFLLVSVAVHEFAHALAADRLGDPTARLKGRLSLNPLVHIDLMGLLFILFWGFGWGKPVPYDPFNLRDSDKDGAKIALAGPVSSLLLALVASLVIRLIDNSLIELVLSYLVMLNVYLGIFNLLPIHPLDGFQVMAGILPESQRSEWYGLRRYGIVILLFMLLPISNGQSTLFTIIGPVVNFILGFLLPGGNIL
jgi:Zn-dependent protease